VSFELAEIVDAFTDEYQRRYTHLCGTRSPIPPLRAFSMLGSSARSLASPATVDSATTLHPAVQ